MTEEAKACYSIVLCRWQNKGKKKKDKSKQVDLYALLGLANERWTATDAQIKLGELSQLQHLLSQASMQMSCHSRAAG